ncbi:DUF2155 domain-containing protein [Kordiimonas aquimaris]|uniref:DUF2155 domain-containing protein n=1 Tax=Kordiimonas aquimaris TaxID=707591 RepID=UPI0021D0EFB6|nr:DUF2155 domain-containing protein [Kordiimonas aquimaris]
MTSLNKAYVILIAWLGSLIIVSYPALTLQSNRNIIQPSELESQSGEIVLLRALDKITARITEIELAVGAETTFGTLTIRAKYCRTRPPIQPPETFAYLEIDDLKRTGNYERVFEGWMVASSPSLNALEHAVYDIWVINCKALSPATSG